MPHFHKCKVIQNDCRLKGTHIYTREGYGKVLRDPPLDQGPKLHFEDWEASIIEVASAKGTLGERRGMWIWVELSRHKFSYQWDEREKIDQRNHIVSSWAKFVPQIRPACLFGSSCRSLKCLMKGICCQHSEFHFEIHDFWEVLGLQNIDPRGK